jgi:hypothetical protein
VPEAHRGHDVAGIGLADLLPLVGMHLQQPADALLGALGGVQHRGPGGEGAGVEAQEGEMSHVGIGEELEGQRRQRGVIRGGALFQLALGIEPLHRGFVRRGGEIIHHRIQ